MDQGKLAEIKAAAHRHAKTSISGAWANSTAQNKPNLADMLEAEPVPLIAIQSPLHFTFHFEDAKVVGSIFGQPVTGESLQVDSRQWNDVLPKIEEAGHRVVVTA